MRILFRYYYELYKTQGIKTIVPLGRLSPTHSCLEDGSHVTGQCPASPISQVPGSQSKGTPPNQTGEGGNPQSPHRPLLCDMEGNRRERPEYGNKKASSASLDHLIDHCYLVLYCDVNLTSVMHKISKNLAC